MNNSSTMAKHYGESAYNSKQVEPQPQPQAKGLWQTLIASGNHFSLNRLSNNSVTSLISDCLPSEWPKIEQDINKKLPPWWTEQRLEQHKLNGWSQLYLFVCGLAKVACIVFLHLSSLLKYRTILLMKT